MSNVGPNVNVERDIRELIAVILEIEPGELNPQASFVKDLGMDSMMALEVLATIEKKYRIIIPEDNLPKFTNLNETVNIVTQLLQQQKK